jgi:RimJ/RimL family protein N-acetyltransferase
MLARCAELSFAKQPIVERCSGAVLGDTGVDWIEFDGLRWLEWGYRLVPATRGKGYATEASLALLEVASNDCAGEVLGIIHPDNRASQNVIRKLGFAFWKQAPVQGDLRNLYRLDV